MTIRAVTFALPLLVAVMPAGISTAQVPPAQAGAPATATLNAAARREVVADFARALREQYVFPAVAECIAAALERALAAGDYDRFGNPVAFAQRLSADAAAIAHDKHLRVSSLGTPPEEGRRAMPRAEGGVVRADRLADGIGYIEVVGFPPPPVFRAALDKALSGLKGSRALIVDVRRNGGGSPEAVAYLVSSLIEPGRPVNTIVTRVARTDTFTREAFRSVPTPVSFANVPVYVLTSRDTFSGGEEFAYDMQALKRGISVGEVTGGGANPTGAIDLEHEIEASIPFGRAENPYTRTNWEGRGVRPDVPTAAGDALKVALVRAGGKPVGDVDAASIARVFAPRASPRPGSERALRRLLAGFAVGEADYDALTPEVAAMTRRQLPELRAEFAPLGSLQSLEFLGPDMMGGDEYALHFAGGDRMMALVIGPDGKVAALSSAMPLAPGN